MKNEFTTRHRLPTTLAFALLAVVACPASATDVTKLEGVTVTADRQMTVERPSGVVDRELRVKTTVAYSDLDLGSDKGRKELEARITQAASDVCTELDKLLPARTLEHGNCVQQTVERAMGSIKAH